MKLDTRLIAFYLPQFHPIPENDAWWGEGFTEWTNVVKGQPLFRGHEQPRLPGELGFYDLRDAHVRAAQAALAREYGIHGFCYYHYWFNGKRLLDRPLDAVLSSGEPNFPFCVCWANENWTRAWDGLEREVLIRQHYGADDDRAHIRFLATVMRDRRYIRVDGKPLLLIYRVSRLPNPAATAALWREEAKALGVGELFLANVQSFEQERIEPASIGFDAAIEFQPDWTNLGRRRWQWWRGPAIYDYEAIVARMCAKLTPAYPFFRCVTPSWDNTARRKRNGLVLAGSTPEAYQRWLECAIETTATAESGDRIVFVNAWNEWAEGAHLEPSERWGRRYLEATRAALLESCE